MATQIVLRGGQALAVYDDRWRCVYEALGTLSVQRATDVEFDGVTGEWVATHQASGQVIGRGPNRSEVVAQEVAWLEANQSPQAEGRQQENQNQAVNNQAVNTKGELK